MSDDEARVLAARREAAHDYANPALRPDDAHYVGLKGELAFAKAFGLKVDRRDGGDGGVDFTVRINGKAVTIDVKTTRAKDNARNLQVLKSAIDRAANILVLAVLDHDAVTFVGWETRAIMALAPTSEFLKGSVSHFKPREQLRPMSQLVDLMAMREEVEP